MAEIKRILLSRKMLILFVLAVVMNCVFFALECSDERQITLQGEELTAYLESYPDFLASVSENADGFSAISILQKKDSFSTRNIKQTAEDYSRLDITPEYGENRGTAAYSNYVTSDFLLAAFVLFAVTGFTDERRKGIAGIVKCTRNGRLPLGVHRIGMIVIAALFAGAVFALSTIITGTVLFGDFGLARPIQSVPEFKLCPFGITIGGYFVLSALMKALAAAMIGVLVFVFSSLFDTIPSVVISSVLLAGHWLLNALIIPTDSLNFLKFVNIFALLKNDVFFKNYCNLNLFGQPVYFTQTAVICVTVAFVLFSAAALFISAGRTPATVTEIGIFTRLGSKISSKMPQLPLLFWETKKVLINRKGLVIIAAAVYLSIYSLLQYRYIGFVNQDYEKMYKKYSGIVTEELVGRITDDFNKLDSEVAKLVDEINAHIDAGDEPELYMTMYQRCENLKYQRHLTEDFMHRAEDCFAYTRESGFPVEIIRQDTYDLLLASDSGTALRNGLYVLIALIGTFGGIISYEKQSNMSFTLKCSKRGRARLLAHKAALIFAVSIILSAVVNLAQLHVIAESMGLNNIEASCQSVIMLRPVRFALSIREYLIMMYIVRALLTVVVGLAIMGISAMCPNDMISFGMGAVLLIVPSVLKSAGITFFFSFTELLAAVPV